MRQVGIALVLVALAGAGASAQEGSDNPPPPAAPAWEHIVTKRQAPDRTGAPVSAAERAARLAEGRRKFFQRQQGFEHELAPPVITTNIFPTDSNGLPQPGLPSRPRR